MQLFRIRKPKDESYLEGVVRLFTVSGEFDTSGQTSLKGVRKRGCSTARRGGAKRRKNSPQATVFSLNRP